MSMSTTTRQKHTVTEKREVTTSGFPEVVIVMASGREWHFRRTYCTRGSSSVKTTRDHLMSCKSSSTRPTYDYASEYKVAKEAAKGSLSRIEAELRASGSLNY